jgi:hypothetical protein
VLAPPRGRSEVSRLTPGGRQRLPLAPSRTAARRMRVALTATCRSLALLPAPLEASLPGLLPGCSSPPEDQPLPEKGPGPRTVGY